MTKDNLERVLMGRLAGPVNFLDYPQAPVPYLIGSYGRASASFRTLGNSAGRSELEELLALCKELCVNFVQLLLDPNTSLMFPQPEQALHQGTLQLLTALKARYVRDTTAVQMPPDFLEDFALKWENEGLLRIVNDLSTYTGSALQKMTAIAETAFPLSVLSLMASVRPLARCFVQTDSFLPTVLSDGRAIMDSTPLGHAFALAILSDDEKRSATTPDVRDQYFSNLSTRSATDVNSAITALRLTSQALASTLHSIVRELLKKDTRERMLAWLFGAVESNGERAKTFPDYKLAASNGFFMNLAAVCLKLCQPFMQPSPKTWARIDAEFVVLSDQVDFWGETKLSASQEEEAAWKKQRQESHAAASTSTESTAGAPEYPFICQAFFLTAKVLHLGPVHILQLRTRLARNVAHLEQEVAALEKHLEQLSEPQLSMARLQHKRSAALLDRQQGELMLINTQLQDGTAMADVLAYYRLMAAWLLHLAAPDSVASGDVDLPLPTPPPMTFRTLPEYFVEDMLEVLEWVAHVLPSSMEANPAEFINFVIVFLGSADYIRNAHLRAKLVDLLHTWIQPQLGDETLQSRRSPVISSLLNLIEWQPSIQQNMVRGLLQLFLDIERTDRSNTFYEKFTTRYKAGEILCYLWTIPQHREVWKRLAAEKGGRGLYLSFCDIICNDSQYLLDDVIKMLPEVRAMEDLLLGQEWQQMDMRERQERESTYRHNAHNLQTDLYLASVYIRVMRISTAEVTTTWLLPEMATRVAAMLNYFLDHLAGREKRKNLRVRQPEKYKWKPQELLAQLAHIYLHLARADSAGLFVGAIAADERSYHEGLFSDAADVLRKFGLLDEGDVDELEAVGERVQVARLTQAADDDVLGDAPDEFLDPVTFDLMTDPVLLPRQGGGQQISMDRASITRHLLSNNTDPFSKQPLSADQLVPNTELKQRIEAWKQAQRAGSAQAMQQ